MNVEPTWTEQNYANVAAHSRQQKFQSLIFALLYDIYNDLKV